jgi:exopolyphosphatase/guanosine-5'-triphosphate,3'-diphosphate pyrophosphatase
MLAAVDMGTNSFHMVVVRADKQGQFELVDTAKEDVRLGSGSPDISIITPDAEERALAVIKRFKQLAKMRNADMRIVATSAVREARNRRMFVRRMLEVAGVEIEVLSGQEEACLIYQGVLQALPVYDKTVLVVDIGGGSTEFVLGKAGKPLYATSLKLGHIRLSEQFLGLGRSREELKKEQVMDTLQFHQ